MKKFLYLLLPALLLGGMGYAQDIPASSTAEVPSTVQSKRASKFQGLWQQRKGHNLRLDYGFQADLIGLDWAYNKYSPIRFDLEYQYDIPWNPKRINFYAYVGIFYKRLKIDYEGYSHIPDRNTRLNLENSLGGYCGIGLKIHCTDFLYFSFSQALNLTEKMMNESYPKGYNDFNGHVYFGSQTAIRIVGQIKQFSIHLGYRMEHWQNNSMDHVFPINKSYENYLTFGIGYDF